MKKNYLFLCLLLISSIVFAQQQRPVLGKRLIEESIISAKMDLPGDRAIDGMIELKKANLDRYLVDADGRIAVHSVQKADNILLFEDFNELFGEETNYMPAGWDQYDFDLLGFDAGLIIPELAGFLLDSDWWQLSFNDGDYSMISFSDLYDDDGNPAGPADDWMVTSAVTLSNLKGNTVSVDARSLSAQYPDGMQLWVIEDAVYNAMANKTAVAFEAAATKVYNSTAEPVGAWITRVVSLDSFMGKTIRIMIRNNSSEMLALGVDNLVITAGDGTGHDQNWGFNSLPSEWTLPAAGWKLHTSWNPNSYGAKPASSFIFFDAFNTSSSEPLSLVSNRFYVGSKAKTLVVDIQEFLMNINYIDAGEKLYLEFSEDNGVTWTTSNDNILAQLVGYGTSTTPRTFLKFDLSAYVDKDINIRFRGISDYGASLAVIYRVLLYKEKPTDLVASALDGLTMTPYDQITFNGVSILNEGEPLLPDLAELTSSVEGQDISFTSPVPAVGVFEYVDVIPTNVFKLLPLGTYNINYDISLEGETNTENNKTSSIITTSPFSWAKDNGIAISGVGATSADVTFGQTFSFFNDVTLGSVSIAFNSVVNKPFALGIYKYNATTNTVTLVHQTADMAITPSAAGEFVEVKFATPQALEAGDYFISYTQRSATNPALCYDEVETSSFYQLAGTNLIKITGFGAILFRPNIASYEVATTFDENVLPAGYSLDPDTGNESWKFAPVSRTMYATAGVNPILPEDGTYMWFDGYSASKDKEGKLVSPIFSVDKEDYYIHFDLGMVAFSALSSGTGMKLFVDLSKDGGETWINGTTDYAKNFPFPTVRNAVQTVKVNIDELNGEVAKFRIRAVSDWGYTGFWIDNIKLVYNPYVEAENPMPTTFAGNTLPAGYTNFTYEDAKWEYANAYPENAPNPFENTDGSFAWFNATYWDVADYAILTSPVFETHIKNHYLVMDLAEVRLFPGEAEEGADLFLELSEDGKNWNRVANLVDQLPGHNTLSYIGGKVYYDLKNYIEKPVMFRLIAVADHGAAIFAVDNIILDKAAPAPIKEHVCNIPEISSLEIKQTSKDIILNWSLEGEGPSGPGYTGEIGYTGNAIDNAFGGVADYEVAIRFTPEDLTQYANSTLTKVMFGVHPQAGSTPTTVAYTVRIYQGGNSTDAGILVSEQAVTNYAADWNTVELTTPVAVDTSKELWIVLHTVEIGGAANPPFSMNVNNTGTAIRNKSDLANFSDGDGWFSWNDYLEENEQTNLSNNWAIKGYLESASGAPAILTPIVHSTVANANVDMDMAMQSLLSVVNLSPKADYLFFEGFNEGIPSSWINRDADGDTFAWYDLYADSGEGGFDVYEGNGFVTSASWQAQTPLTPDNWLISPAITLTSNNELSFAVGAQDADFPADKYAVYISTTNTDQASFTKIFEETLSAAPGKAISGNNPLMSRKSSGAKAQGSWKVKTVDLSSYAGQTVYIAFRHYDCTDNFRMNLDAVKISGTGGGEPGGGGSLGEGQSFTVTRNGEIIAEGLTTGTYTDKGAAKDIKDYVYCVYIVQDEDCVGEPICEEFTPIFTPPARPVSWVKAELDETNVVTVTWANTFASAAPANTPKMANAEFIAKRAYAQGIKSNKAAAWSTNFASGFPQGWTVENNTNEASYGTQVAWQAHTTWNESSYGPKPMSSFIWFDSYNFATLNPAYLITAPFDITNASKTLVITLQEVVLGPDYFDPSTGGDKIYVDVSTNGGSTWIESPTSILANLPGHNTTDGTELSFVNVDLTEYVGKSIKIRFRGISAYSCGMPIIYMMELTGDGSDPGGDDDDEETYTYTYDLYRNGELIAAGLDTYEYTDVLDGTDDYTYCVVTVANNVFRSEPTCSDAISFVSQCDPEINGVVNVAVVEEGERLNITWAFDGEYVGPKFEVYVNGSLIGTTGGRFLKPLKPAGAAVAECCVVFVGDYCKGEPVCASVEIDKGVTDIKEVSDIATVRPTLTDGPVKVTTNKDAIVKVMDLSGRTLDVYESEGELDITLNYNSGVYMIVVEVEGNPSVHKVVLKK